MRSWSRGLAQRAARSQTERSVRLPIGAVARAYRDGRRDRLRNMRHCRASFAMLITVTPLLVLYGSTRWSWVAGPIAAALMWALEAPKTRWQLSVPSLGRRPPRNIDRRNVDRRNVDRRNVHLRRAGRVLG